MLVFPKRQGGHQPRMDRALPHVAANLGGERLGPIFSLSLTPQQQGCWQMGRHCRCQSTWWARTSCQRPPSGILSRSLCRQGTSSPRLCRSACCSGPSMTTPPPRHCLSTHAALSHLSTIADGTGGDLAVDPAQLALPADLRPQVMLAPVHGPRAMLVPSSGSYVPAHHSFRSLAGSG